ncbi:MAG: hypothetical protein IT394_02080 [Candidatus Omnitrophica bacterium]|nr:hypothetical protein [bacterium]MBK7493977.1 hypothetical protein [Candidatus Omnitrophota bacterium]MCC6731993.1 hypothetical protein [Candidatus Omnitrophota bacterium]
MNGGHDPAAGSPQPHTGNNKYRYTPNGNAGSPLKQGHTEPSHCSKSA